MGLVGPHRNNRPNRYDMSWPAQSIGLRQSRSPRAGSSVRRLPALVAAAATLCLASTVAAQLPDASPRPTAASQAAVPVEAHRPIPPEQRRLDWRNPSQLPQIPLPTTAPPPTVNDTQEARPIVPLTLNDAINWTLTGSEVVRVIGGVTATTSGRTIYDAAITNTGVDQQRAAFDPNVRLNQLWNQLENPNAAFDPLDPTGAIISSLKNEGYSLDLDVTQRNLSGGTTRLGVRAGRNRIEPGIFPLNPSGRTATELQYTQPLLRGAGREVNQVPIVLARIDTERSYFQFKDAVQASVQSVVEAYWTLVLAKVDLWAREQQVKQANFAFQRAQARVDVGDANAGELAQTRLALENFRASLLASQANLLQREAALLSILGLPPTDPTRPVPMTPPLQQPVTIEWNQLNDLAQRHRPDIIELKLILEADQQRVLLANNDARPRFDGIALYRWNGLEGITPAGQRVSSGGDQFTDWSLGVNFSVPLGLRRERAVLRQLRLILRRDRANLDQALLQMQHQLALNVRNLDQFYAQYERFQAVRRAARRNLEQQLAQYNAGIVQFIVVLQAIVDWGNSVSSEAQALTNYNIELARLERQSGTILESHGVFFFEERFRAIGPLGRWGPEACYPESLPVGAAVSRYPSGDQPAEQAFGLEDPIDREGQLPAPDASPLELEEDVQFERLDPNQDGPISDEEIDQILEDKTLGDRARSLLRRLHFFR